MVGLLYPGRNLPLRPFLLSLHKLQPTTQAVVASYDLKIKVVKVSIGQPKVLGDYRQDGIGGIREVTSGSPNSIEAFPEGLDVSKPTTNGRIFCIPGLSGAWDILLELMDEGGDPQGIDHHGKGVPLCETLSDNNGLR